jgi:hypothetical protein
LRSDYQFVDSQQSGYLRVLSFSPINNQIHVTTYSPNQSKYLSDSSNDFYLPYTMVGVPDFAYIGSTTIPSGSPASISWPGRSGSTAYEWYAVADNGGAASASSPTWSFTTATNVQSIPLELGWNLVSFSLHPTNTLVANVLASVAPNYDLVYAWNATVSTDNWLRADNIPASPDTLINLDEKMGFWIHMTSADSLDVVGSTPTTTDIPLAITAGGWNLVGYPSAALDRALPGAMTTHSNLVYAYHAADTADQWKLYDRNGLPYANDLDYLRGGWGYWILVTANEPWTIPY